MAAAGQVINSVPGSVPTAPAYSYTVKMTCGGCSGAVNRVLGKNVAAPNAYHISLPTQRVLVWGPSLPPFETITEKIAKTGKEIQSKEVIDDAQKLPSIEA
ncbi:copper chaperone [Kwoniella heveanensis BCC8398]|uniref:Copper chaperone n=1 Tax=Kwoniella heveanensis BCC8398 TaxID=1296120 RepID=A0A1B9H1C6_9TREE|nr:copper chaperone [Kwoniella heveanensis BCC8398]